MRLPALALILLATVVADAAYARTALRVQYPNPATFRDVQNALAERFERLHPDVDIVFDAPAASYEDMLQRTLRAGLTGDLPDVGVYAYSSADTLAARGLLPPLSEQERASLQAASALLEDPEQGASACVPLAISVPLLYVNLDLVRRSGAEVPAEPTWSDIARIAAATAAAPGGNAGVWLPLDVLSDWVWQILVESRGGHVIDPASGAITAFTGPAAQAALRDYVELAGPGYFFASSNQAVQALAGGKLAVMLVSNAVLKRLDSQVGGRFARALWPTPVEGAGARRPVGGNCIAVLTRDPARRAAALAYVRFLTGTEGGVMLARATGYLPPDPEAQRIFLESLQPDVREALEQSLAHGLSRWRSYPGRAGVRSPMLIRRTLEQIHLQPDRDPREALDRLSRKILQLAGREEPAP